MTTSSQEHWLSWKNIKQNIHDVFTWQYYKEGFSGWSTQSYIWLAVGLTVIIGTGFMHGFSTMTLISVLGGAIGFTCTLAITNAKRLNGVLGFVSAFLISYVAWHANNNADIFMQMGYVLALDIPVILFGNAWNERKIHDMDKMGWLILIGTFVVMFGFLFWIDTHVFISPRPWIDAFSAAVGFTGAALMLGKYSTQYVLWTIQGVTSLILWFMTAQQGDANWVLFATYMLYIGNDILGLFFSPWRLFNRHNQNS
ncbi:nicotinamide mononucleotide transporter [Weissella uvarum]|uniref:nicotinamide riboside transporter PnuC n=1 Tax=Weissella uvarum TaxID=1479233 RepID=UPI001961DFF4|nr:nicotinamide riboside transporter PnuC [Weissella uvarum]MBM7617533.1 nicotinamide mononucleotide transporter [Weissella uvarum]MCM0595583.1 nicotinamide mononucleotide transporter [Weissella uvarum]